MNSLCRIKAITTTTKAVMTAVPIAVMKNVTTTASPFERPEEEGERIVKVQRILRGLRRRGNVKGYCNSLP